MRVRMLFEGKPRTKIEGSQAQKEAGALAGLFPLREESILERQLDLIKLERDRLVADGVMVGIKQVVEFA